MSRGAKSSAATPSLEACFADLRDDLERTLTSLIKTLEQSRMGAGKVVQAQALLAKLCSRQFQMAVVAMIKAGKSTLINAWLGDAILPVANTVETARIVQIRHHADRTPRLVIAGKSVAIGTTDIEAWLRTANRDARKSKFATPEKSVELHAEFASLHGRPTEKYSFLLLDTPGPNEAGGADPLRETIDQVLRGSDVLIYVFDYTHMKGEDEAIFLKRMKQRATLLQQYANKLFVVVNKFDQKNRTGMTAEETKDHVIGILEPIVKLRRDQVFAVSAERALLARMVATGKGGAAVRDDFKLREFGEGAANDVRHLDETTLIEAAQHMLQRSNVGALEEAVITNLYRNSARMLFEGVIADSEEILGEMENHAAMQKSTLSSSVDQSRAQVKKLRGDIEKIRGRLQGLSEAVTKVETEITSWIEGEFKAFRAAIERTIDDAFDGKPLPSTNILRQIGEFVAKVASPSRNIKEVEVNTDRLNKYIADYLEDSWRNFRNRLEDKALDQQKQLFEELKKAAQPIVDAVDATVSKRIGITLKPSRVRIPELTMSELHDEIDAALSNLIEKKRESHKRKTGTKRVLVAPAGCCRDAKYKEEEVYETTHVQTARASIDNMKEFWSGRIKYMTTASVRTARSVVVERVRTAVVDMQTRVTDRADGYIDRMEADIATAERSDEDRRIGLASARALLSEVRAMREQVEESREFLATTFEASA